MSFEIKQEGRRLYVMGNTYAIKDSLKCIGAKWDADVRSWWVGTTKRTELEKLLAQPAESVAEPTEQRIMVTGKATYKGRTYYVRWAGVCKSGERKARLTTLDGKIDFWAQLGDPMVAAGGGDGRAMITKEYREPRSLAGIRKYVDELKQHGGDSESLAIERAEKSGVCRGCRQPIRDASYHRAMDGYCGSCAFDELDC